MEYGWNIDTDDSFTFGSLSREFYYANLLIDEIISENVREVRRLLKFHQARADLVVPERGAAALHVLAGLEAEDFAAAVTQRVLRRTRADPDVRSEEGLTPTHVAATYGRCRVLEVRYLRLSSYYRPNRNRMGLTELVFNWSYSYMIVMTHFSAESDRFYSTLKRNKKSFSCW